MIVTGQQPAVGGGPLYTLVKIAHAVALGRARNEPVLFWCASEDHDLGEAGHADIIRRDGTITRFTGDLGGGRASLRFRPANRWWPGLLAHVEREVGPGLGAEFLRRHAPEADEGMGAWLCRLVAVLFPGIETVEAYVLRPRWAAAMARALSAWPAGELAALRTHLLASGAADAFGDLAEPPLFHDLANGRVAVDRVTAATIPLADLSPGAALRPILQQAALPCTAYVGGPGELAYHRFITPLYAALGVARPELIPRASLTLVPGWCARALAGHGLTAETADQVQAAAALSDPRLAPLDAVIANLAADPALAGSARRLARERAHLARRLQRLAERRAGRMPLGSLRAYLSPRGARQERTMSLIQALWEHGPGLAQVLVAQAATCAPGEHRFIAL